MRRENNSNKKEDNGMTLSLIVGLILGIVLFIATKEILFLSAGFCGGLFVGCVKLFFGDKKNNRNINRICMK